jgi:hypothetical protein
MGIAAESTPDEQLRYPVGRFQRPQSTSAEERERWIEGIECLPAQLRAATGDLDEQQLDTPYRPAGWTVRQLVHHVADSHINSYVRFRLALTEQMPLIKPYDEKAWAELADARTAPVELSLRLLESIHGRWIILLRSMTDQDFLRKYRHPEMGESSLDAVLPLYAWHSRHHLAHINNLRARSGW